MNKIFALLKKDVLLEFRQQHTFYGMLLYIASTVFVLYLSIENPDLNVWSGLFWVIQLFICVNAVAKSFLQEGKSSPTQFIVAKILYNILIMSVMSLLSLVLFSIFMGNPVTNISKFVGIVLLGGASISMVFSIMSAIAAKAQQNAALIAILGFPVILPLLLLLMRLSKTAFNEVFKEGAVLELIGLITGLDALIAVLAIILFPYLWKD
jgi:heme exporter protein B